jgi:hypothetical protein
LLTPAFVLFTLPEHHLGGFKNGNLAGHHGRHLGRVLPRPARAGAVDSALSLRRE